LLPNLVREVVEEIPRGVFTTGELAALGDRTKDSLYASTKRALASGDFVQIRRGLYALAPYLRKRPVEAHLVAQEVYGPSYVSLETALSMHGWIPEAVYSTSCVTSRASIVFRTPLGIIEYERSRQTALFAGVLRFVVPMGDSFFLAKPLKALADYVDVRRLSWDSIDPVRGSLRVEDENLESLGAADFDELVGVYEDSRVARFLDGLRRDLGV
jgi:hypothetical protein